MSHMKWFGDVYTYTHRALLHAIAEPGEWFVHPMLFRSEGKRPRQPGGGLDAATYADAIGLPFEHVLKGNDRTRQQLEGDVAVHPECHLFLDPDTGICEREAQEDTSHISVSRVARVAKHRQGKIVMVFDHAYPDGGAARQKVLAKLLLFADNCLPSAAVMVREHRYVCYVLVSTDRAVLADAMQGMRDELRIPCRWLVPGP